jgi:hypothetical protein
VGPQEPLKLSCLCHISNQHHFGVQVAEQVVLLIFIQGQAAVDFLDNPVGQLLIGKSRQLLGVDAGRDRPEQTQDGWVNENILDQSSHWKI